MSESSRRRGDLEAYRVMSVRELMNLAHAALPDVHSGPRQRSARARTAAIAGELMARGEEASAALLRGHRRTARTAATVQWTQDHAGRLIPVALPDAYDRVTGLARRRPRLRGRASR